MTASPDSSVKKMSAKYTILSNHNLPIGHPFKQKIRFHEKAADLAGISDNHTSAFPQDNTVLQCAAEVLCVHLPYCHTEQ